MAELPLWPLPYTTFQPQEAAYSMCTTQLSASAKTRRIQPKFDSDLRRIRLHSEHILKSIPVNFRAKFSVHIVKVTDQMINPKSQLGKVQGTASPQTQMRLKFRFPIGKLNVIHYIYIWPCRSMKQVTVVLPRPVPFLRGNGELRTSLASWSRKEGTYISYRP